MTLIKRIPLKILIPAAVCVLALLVSLCSYLSVSSDKRALPAQDAAARWRGGSDERFTQVSVFLPESAGLTVEKLYEFRSSLETRFLSESLEAEEGASLYRDAYTAFFGAVTAKGDYGSSPVQVYALGGDWFFFHPLPLVSGGYIRGDELMHDRVVLDTVAAWQLFGATDVAGRTLVMDGA
ncbi:MAG: ABC transporter permease, partial [Oscillospiraceae bacterium]|nr:ABC transporter permease [Oscillospiraceae bacterium]